MIKSAKENIISAARVKSAIQENHLTQATVAELVGKSTETICKVANGQYALSEKLARQLAPVLHVRAEWLLGRDEFKTGQELTEYTASGPLREYKSVVSFMLSIGFTVLPKTYITLPGWCIALYESELIPCVDGNELDYVLSEYKKYNEMVERSSDRVKSTLSGHQPEYRLRLVKPLPGLPFVSNGFSGDVMNVTLPASHPNNPLPCDVVLLIDGFTITHNGKTSDISAGALERVAGQLKAVSTAVLESSGLFE